MVNPPSWMQQPYEVWYRDVREVVHQILGNPSYPDEMDLRPFREFSSEGDQRQYCDFMSGDWVWDQAVSIWDLLSRYLTNFTSIGYNLRG